MTDKTDSRILEKASRIGSAQAVLTFEAKFDELFRDRSRLDRLMALAKSLRKTPGHKLVFVGPSIIARYYWCAMQSGYAAREDELNSFAQYLAAQNLQCSCARAYPRNAGRR